jgi:hypothetical protein
MACDLTIGRATACKSVGGIKHIEIANWTSAKAAVTFAADGSVSAMGAATTFFKYDVRGASNVMDETGESSRDNNSKFYTIAGSYQLPYQDELTTQELEIVASTRCFVITEDFNGVRKIYGLSDGCDLSVSTNSGAAMGDFNGYTVAVTGINPTLAPMVDGATSLTTSASQISPN